MSKIAQKPFARRIVELDLLRGYFIVIIILDHLQFWPSPFQYITGQGRLWVSAAEGFFIISGLLIGYLRLYKGVDTPLKDLSKKLLSRAGVLWIWCVIVTAVFVWMITVIPTSPLLPKFPSSEITASLPSLIWNIVTMNYAIDWIYFLRLYAIMLAATPLFLWLVRKGWWLSALAISFGAFALSCIFGWSEMALQWQFLFFGAALIGWKLEAILSWLRRRPQLRTILIWTLIIATIFTMLLSYFMVHGWSYVESDATRISRESYVSIRANVDPLFSNNPLAPLRVLLSFLWFGGMLALFHVLKKYLVKYAGWILLEFGQASLTAYTLHAFLLPLIVAFVQLDGSFWVNTLASVIILVFFWGLMRIPFVKKILPQ